jgi:hypothetical protein
MGGMARTALATDPGDDGDARLVHVPDVVLRWLIDDLEQDLANEAGTSSSFDSRQLRGAISQVERELGRRLLR